MKYDVEVQGVEAAFAGLDPSTIAKGTARALTKIATLVRTGIKQSLRQRYTLKAGKINEAIKVIPAKPYYLVSTVKASGRRMSFVHYVMRQTRRGTSVRVKRSKGATVQPGKFIQTIGQYYGVFFRPDRRLFPKRPGNLPIHAFQAPAITQLFGSRESFGIMQRMVDERLSTVLAHEIFFEVNKKVLRPKGRGV